MCGLIFGLNKKGKPVKNSVWKRYKQQKSRGQNGFGFAIINQNNLQAVHRHTDEKGIHPLLTNTTAPAILFHHRLPTSTPNIIESAHPIEINLPELKYRYLVAHNGIITNADELHTQHKKENITYKTEIIKQLIASINTYQSIMFNDSEAGAIELARAIENPTADRVKIDGAAAFIALQLEKETDKIVAVLFCRNNSNPLIYNDNKDLFTITSEGSGEMISPHILYSLNLITLGITTRKLTIGNEPAQTMFSYGNWIDSYQDPYSEDEDEDDIIADEAYLRLAERRDKLEKKMLDANLAQNFKKEIEYQDQLQAIELQLLNYENELLSKNYQTL